MPTDNTFGKVDFLFVGGGASATLLLLSMEKNGLLANNKVVVIDPDLKLKNDKTFCFWTNKSEQPSLLCAPFISKEWNSFRGQQDKIETEKPLRYCMVKSSDLYAEMNRMVSQYCISRNHETVEQLIDTAGGVQVVTNQQSHHARLVFDSRPPQFSTPQANEQHLHQSFLGYFIHCDNPNTTADAVDLMDFNVSQAGETQFFYVLPFDAQHMLVELTRFGKEVINEAQAAVLLDAYILQRFGTYQVLETERGNIPMSTAGINVPSQPNVIPIGARAGAIKPSTGYAFKKMMEQASAISTSLVEQTVPVVPNKKNRFQLYDRLLLTILSNKPHLGKKIFQQLFEKNSTAAVLRFLDEKSSFKEELRLFSSLPILTFLQAFFYDVFHTQKRLIGAVALVLVALLLVIVQQLDVTVFAWTSNGLLLFGLVLVGIPHGAIDHLLTNDKQVTRPSIGFIVRYLSSAVALFALWLLAPSLALLLFIIYSSWHFGESDVFQWGITKNSVALSWYWGSSLLLFILMSHYEATQLIIAQLGIKLPLSIGNYATMISYGLLLVMMLLVIRKQNMLMFLSLIMLLFATQLPLLTAFGLYFIGQHSLNSWSHIKKGLAITNKQFFLKAFPFTFGAFLLFGFLIYLIKNEIITTNNENIIAFFFIFISCISLPHILVIHGFYRRFHLKK